MSDAERLILANQVTIMLALYAILGGEVMDGKSKDDVFGMLEEGVETTLKVQGCYLTGGIPQ